MFKNWFNIVKKELNEYRKQGGNEKMKEVTLKDLDHGKKVVKEFVTYDFPQAFKKMLRSLNPKNFRKED